MGFAVEVEVIREAHGRDLLTAPYVSDPEQAAADDRGRGHHRDRRFFGASSMERLPTEKAIAARAAAFKDLRRAGAS